MECAGCGAWVARFDAACSYCGRDVPGRLSPSAAAEVLLARAGEALAAGENARALESAVELTEREPELVDGWYYRAAAWQALGRNDRALEAMERVAALRPGSATAAFNLGLLLGDTGRLDEALPHLERALERVDRDPDPALRPEQIADIRARGREWRDALREGRIPGRES